LDGRIEKAQKYSGKLRIAIPSHMPDFPLFSHKSKKLIGNSSTYAVISTTSKEQVVFVLRGRETHAPHPNGHMLPQGYLSKQVMPEMSESALDLQKRGLVTDGL
jgi:hypothetical protein